MKNLPTTAGRGNQTHALGDQKGGYGIGRPRSGGRFVDLLIISNKDFRLKSQYATTQSQSVQLIMSIEISD